MSHRRAHVTLRPISNTGDPPHRDDRHVRSRRQSATGEPSPSDAPTETAQPDTEDASHLRARASLNLGQRFGHYYILRLLGGGGMGEVYEAEDEESGRHVALKTVRNMSSDRLDRARFLQEGRLAASISHPNVVYVFGTEEIDGIPVICRDDGEGPTDPDPERRTGSIGRCCMHLA